jgi:hypothetical protein
MFNNKIENSKLEYKIFELLCSVHSLMLHVDIARGVAKTFRFVILFLFTISNLTTLSAAGVSDLNYNSLTNGGGAIVTLARGKTFQNEKRFYKVLIKHNIAIERYAYLEGIDVIIFHEGDILDWHQRHIAEKTPNLPLKFINVSDSFQMFQRVNNSFCPNPGNEFGGGYRSMCRFWFSEFTRYLSNYDWVFRLDEDCIATNDIKHFLGDKKLVSKIHVAASMWIDLARAKTDVISPVKEDGIFVHNLKKFVRDFASKHSLSRTKVDVSTWKAPYTNCMFLNLNWYRSNKLLENFDKEVIKSQCIYSGRWGDLPLWGAKTLLVDTELQILNFSYQHLSHRVKISPGKKVGRPLS